MDRRSAVSRLAVTLAGVSIGEVPNLEPAAPPAGEPFAVTRANLAQSSGTVTCPVCHEMWDSLELTPAGPCLRCADRDPKLRAELGSDSFWTLSPQEVRRLEPEIERLASRLRRMDDRLLELRQQQIGEGGDGYDRAMEAGRDEWHRLQRELHLLQLLRAASKQAGKRV
jgi:hypothetical protein